MGKFRQTCLFDPNEPSSGFSVSFTDEQTPSSRSRNPHAQPPAAHGADLPSRSRGGLRGGGKAGLFSRTA